MRERCGFFCRNVTEDTDFGGNSHHAMVDSHPEILGQIKVFYLPTDTQYSCFER